MTLRYPNGKVYTRSNANNVEYVKKKTQTSLVYNQGNRGMSLEKDIQDTNVHYQVTGRAIFNKRPTPIQILNVDSSGKVSGFFQEPSTVDFYGVHKGLYIDFEAKETQNKTSFPLNNIHAHQVEHMKNILKHGGKSFLICRFSRLQKTYFLDAKFVIKSWEEMLAGGRKSIPLSFFVEIGIEIPLTYHAKVDYLPIIEEVYL